MSAHENTRGLPSSATHIACLMCRSGGWKTPPGEGEPGLGAGQEHHAQRVITTGMVQPENVLNMKKVPEQDVSDA